MSEKIKLGRRKKSKVRLFGKVLDLPTDPFGKLAYITMKGNREFCVEGCHEIIEYSPMQIQINIGGNTVILKGEDFDMSDFTAGSIRIRGNIISVEFS